jgi:AcrR family transcriptional regulator
MSIKTTTRRERQRAATVDEIKEVARSLMRQHGAADVRLSAIAKQMGMTAPALYNYFAGRDALIEALTADARRELAAEVAAAGESCADDDVGARWLAMGTAYRRWARREPEQFGLVFAPPMRPHQRLGEASTQDAALALSHLAGLFIRAAQSKTLRVPLVREAADDVHVCAASTFPELVDLVPAATFQAMLQAWATVHGFTCLDTYHQLDWMSDQAREQLFAATLQAAALAAGIPAQNGGPTPQYRLLQSLLVPQAGVEPATFRLGGGCSIH